MHGEVPLDRRLEQTEARGPGLLLWQHHEEVEPRIVAESRCDVDVPAIPFPRANDDVLQREAVRAENSARMVDGRLLWRPHTGIEDVHRSRRDERNLRPLVGVCRRRRWAWRFRLLAAAKQLDDRLTDGFDPQASCRQHFGRDAALLAQQPE